MWDSEERKSMNVCRWVEELEKRLEKVRESMKEKMAEGL